MLLTLKNVEKNTRFLFIHLASEIILKNNLAPLSGRDQSSMGTSSPKTSSKSLATTGGREGLEPPTIKRCSWPGGCRPSIPGGSLIDGHSLYMFISLSQAPTSRLTVIS